GATTSTGTATPGATTPGATPPYVVPSAPNAALTATTRAAPTPTTMATPKPAAAAQGVTPNAAKPLPPPQATLDLVRIQIRTVPALATLLIDGARVANPFTAALRHGGTHRIEARAEGYETTARSVSFDRDRSEVLELRTRVRKAPERRASEAHAK